VEELLVVVVVREDERRVDFLTNPPPLSPPPPNTLIPGVGDGLNGDAEVMVPVLANVESVKACKDGGSDVVEGWGWFWLVVEVCEDGIEEAEVAEVAYKWD